MARNLRHAARMHPQFIGEDERSPWTFVPRNWADARTLMRRRCVVMPQNAWPWSGDSGGSAAQRRRLGLRLVSEVTMRAACGVIRIGEAVPALGAVLGPPLSSVLDEGFDDAWGDALSDSGESLGQGALVSIGSLTAYRGLDTLVAGYDSYRRSGGVLDLVIAGPAAGVRIPPSPGLTVYTGGLCRSEVLRSLRDARAVVLPSTVEASPVGALEADAVARVLLGTDIPGHRETTTRADLFPVGDAACLARLLLEVDRGRAPTPPPFHSHSFAADLVSGRGRWSAALAKMLETSLERRPA